VIAGPNKMSRPDLRLMVLLCTVIAACRSSSFDAIVEPLHQGMSTSQVVTAVGKPVRRFDGERRDDWTYFVYSQPSTKQLLVISFKDDILSEWFILVAGISQTGSACWDERDPACPVGPDCVILTDKRAFGRVLSIDCVDVRYLCLRRRPF